MIPEQPLSNDAVLGGDAPFPATSELVLGGLEGIRQQLNSSDQKVQQAGLSKALSCGETGLKLILEFAKTNQNCASVLQVWLINNSQDFSASPQTFFSALKLLPRSLSIDTCIAITENRSTSISILKYIVVNADAQFRKVIAENLSTSISLLKTPAGYEDNYRFIVVSIPLLETLAADQDISVRLAVARNHSTPIAALEHLAKDKETDVRKAVTENLQYMADLKAHFNARNDLDLPREQIEENLSDITDSWGIGDEEIYSSYIEEKLSTPGSLSDNLAKDGDLILDTAIDINIRLRLAENPNTPASLLDHLAKDEDSWVRKAVAQNSNTPVSLLNHLAKDEDSWVRKAVAENASTPTEAILKLLGDENKDVCVLAKKHPNKPQKRWWQF